MLPTRSSSAPVQFTPRQQQHRSQDQPTAEQRHRLEHLTVQHRRQQHLEQMLRLAQGLFLLA